MATYVEYELEDGSKVLISTDEPVGGFVDASIRSGDVVKKAEKRLEEALSSIKPWVGVLSKTLSELKADEVEVTFGLKATGEAGNFAVGKVGVEANYEVTLTWKNKERELANDDQK